MCGLLVGAIMDRPQTTAKQITGDQWSPLQGVWVLPDAFVIQGETCDKTEQ